MKKLFFLMLVLVSTGLNAQITPVDTTKAVKLFHIIKQNGTEYTGTILSDDGREMLIETTVLGKIYILKSEVKSIKEIKDSEAIIGGVYQPTGPFTTRYAFTTNALPIKKGENYSMINLYGPEVHFALTNNLNVGVMTTWIASPLILALKYSFKRKESNVNFSLGSLNGTTGYLNQFKGYGGLHFGTMTLGNRTKNISFSAGYAYLNSGRPNYYNDKNYKKVQYYRTHQGPIFSMAGIVKIGDKVSFVFDAMYGSFTSVKYRNIYSSGFDPITGNYFSTYVLLKEKVTNSILMVMPGMRIQKSDNKAFQISLAGISVFGVKKMSFPFPMCSWMYRF
jgi:hypothetical protein